MSIFNKQWKIQPSAPAEVFKSNSKYPKVVKQLLWNRNIKKNSDIENFFNPDYDTQLHDPYLLKNMDKAIGRIVKAIKNDERILIYGDYDADGVCASALLSSVLRDLGVKNISVYIPDRNDEGYGMNTDAIKKFIKKDINLIITVDCGSTNIEEAQYAQKHGVDVIVTDHHQVLTDKEFCYALVNPHQQGDKYPFKGLSGTAVAFKVAQALLGAPDIPDLGKGYDKWLLDLVAIATVTDVMPLVGENRIFVKYGLLVLAQTKRPGLKTLMTLARVSNSFDLKNKTTQLNTFDIGFILGPRLNAAGRMEHADLAFNLLDTHDVKEAQKLAQKLERANYERRDLVEIILQELEQGDLEKDFAIVAGHENWSIGVLGIAAGRMADKYNKPTFLYQRKKSTLVGSARTPQNFHTVNILAESDNYLKKFGGHAQAGGFTAELRHEAQLSDAIKQVTQKHAHGLGKEDLQPTLNIDTEVKFSDINWDLYNLIDRFAPFGEGNPKPIFVLRNAHILNPQMIGKQSNHFRCYIAPEIVNHDHNHDYEQKQYEPIKRVKAIGFGFSEAENIKDGDNIDIVFELDVDEWNGNRGLLLKLVDIKTKPLK